eukprot:TRINITY_DN446_c0_g2_i1.p1 TRINITY_DN446_c0_g2~~TRINITY_DN446_c0_g2_i1.p1  ORF type:complete len:113 (-),score=14.54 TRINITY_DN446_c0_g2_i1:27-365(-)
MVSVADLKTCGFRPPVSLTFKPPFVGLLGVRYSFWRTSNLRCVLYSDKTIVCGEKPRRFLQSVRNTPLAFDFTFSDGSEESFLAGTEENEYQWVSAFKNFNVEINIVIDLVL